MMHQVGVTRVIRLVLLDDKYSDADVEKIGFVPLPSNVPKVSSSSSSGFGAKHFHTIAVAFST